MTDNINPSAAAARESSRRSSGQFGIQEHSAPEATLSVESNRSRRVSALAKEITELRQKTWKLEDKVKDEMLAQIWDCAPINAAAVHFWPNEGFERTTLEFGGFFDANNEPIELDNDDDIQEAASWLSASDISGLSHRTHAPVVILDAQATRERIDTLIAEHRAGNSGRSGSQIEEEIDSALSRYLRQLAAEQGWDSLDLTWDQEGREGLRLEAIVKDGKRRKAGSGHLDDHEAIWAAARYRRPVAGVMTTSQGLTGPFTITFTN